MPTVRIFTFIILRLAVRKEHDLWQVADGHPLNALPVVSILHLDERASGAVQLVVNVLQALENLAAQAIVLVILRGKSIPLRKEEGHSLSLTDKHGHPLVALEHVSQDLSGDLLDLVALLLVQQPAQDLVLV